MGRGSGSLAGNRPPVPFRVTRPPARAPPSGPGRCQPALTQNLGEIVSHPPRGMGGVGRFPKGGEERDVPLIEKIRQARQNLEHGDLCRGRGDSEGLPNDNDDRAPEISSPGDADEPFEKGVMAVDPGERRGELCASRRSCTPRRPACRDCGGRNGGRFGHGSSTHPLPGSIDGR